MKIIGAVTIGQSPRPDITSELTMLLGPEVRVIESGALDGFTKAEVADIVPRTTGPLLVTRLRDGSEIKIGEDFLIPHLKKCVERLQDKVELILMLCTESLPDFGSARPVVYPGSLLFNIVRALGMQRIGVLTPGHEQLRHQQSRWSKVVAKVVVEAASPYGPPELLQAAAQSLGRNDIDLVVMDCLGYTQSMKKSVRACVSQPVLLARSVLGRIAAELVEGDIPNFHST